ncbi:MAG: hypothetical protein JJU37_06615 [Balneolaceae bacterium]|nr:hypothetical protein [Balneolaceae bacterium]
MNKLLPLFLLSVILAGCVDSEPTQVIDRTSGFYAISGPRITVEDSCFHCPVGENTLNESVIFSLFVQVDPNNSQRIQFYGLQGADTGDMDRRIFPKCTRSQDCEVFGTIQAGGDFEIDIENNGHRYAATGTIARIDNNPAGLYAIQLQGQYSYEDITIDYNLQGSQVSLRLD